MVKSFFFKFDILPDQSGVPFQMSFSSVKMISFSTKEKNCKIEFNLFRSLRWEAKKRDDPKAQWLVNI